MKKLFKLIIVFLFTINITACFKQDNMDDITIYTTVYPIEYVVNRLYSSHSEIKSIYPSGVSYSDYEISKTLLNDFSKDADLFIFNGLSKEQEYIKPMLKQNKDLKIIDVTSSMEYEHQMDELWLDPSNLLTIANNIKKGFDEYIVSNPLKEEVNNNYELLKIDLSNLDAKYRSTVNNCNNPNIIVSSDMFLYLEKYNLNVISLEQNEAFEQKSLLDAKDLIQSGKVNYIFIKDGEEASDTIKNLINGTNIKLIELHTLSTITEVQRESYDYIKLMDENLEALRQQLYL